MNEALLSAKQDDWATPQWLYDQLDQAFEFTLDVCANQNNYKHSNYIDIEQNGLSQDWKGACWMNPPYGRAVVSWVAKAVEEARRGATVVGLVASRTDTRWFQDYATQGEIFFLKGRLTFEGAVNAAPFPSAIIVWYPNLVRKGTYFIPAKAEGIAHLCDIVRGECRTCS